MDVTAPARRRADDPVASLVAGPLNGTTACAIGDSLALRVAAMRLRALGCVVRIEDGPLPSDTPAGWLRVVQTPYGPAGGVLPECRIGWSGPVAVPMSCERDVQAACGIMQVHGRATGTPRVLGVEYASICAGVLAAQAVTAGMLARLRGGTAVKAATSVAQAALLALGQYLATATVQQPGTGEAGSPASSEGPPPFRSADGVRFEIETLDAEDWLRFWTTMGVEHAAIAAGWPPFQQRFATATCTLPTALGAAAASRGYRSVCATARAAGVGILPVRAAEAPGVAVPESPWRLRAVGGPGRVGPVPALSPLGPHDRGPLAGLRVVESTTRVQGPLAGHLLGLLGADVVRIEPPGGDPLRGVPPMAGGCSARFLALNRGKRAVEADLKSASGRRTALDLAGTADVFLQNWPPGRAARFCLDHGDLAAVHPALVYAHAGGWAEALPTSRPPGTDYLVQAYTGVAALLTGPGVPPAPTLMTITDVLGAVIGAEGIVAALLARARSGVGVCAETALVDAAHLIRVATDLTDATTLTGGAMVTEAGAGTGSGVGAVGPAAGVVTDLATMAADPAYAAALVTDGTVTYGRAPWSFAPPPNRSSEVINP